VRIIKSDVFPTASQTLEVREASNEPLNFDDADVIVAAGRGIRNAKNLKLLENLAAIFPKAGLGASRAVCDLGWLGYRHQIGITGQTVSPRLYIACGISGAMQHLAGMKESRIIVAINNDPHAAIFQVADLGIVENLETFIPILLAEFKRQ
jgi:electron transfer flavoprotein alpha subunit